MDGQDEGYNYIADINARIKDLEEKQKALKDRIMLLGDNLMELKENSSAKILEIKKDLELIKQNMDRTVAFIETASKEFSKYAKKEDLDILAKQARMFQPLELLRKKS